MKFFHTDGQEQIDYVKKNINRLIELQNSCSPSNFDKYTETKYTNVEEVKNKYNLYLTESIINFTTDYQNKFFFLFLNHINL